MLCLGYIVNGRAGPEPPDLSRLFPHTSWGGGKVWGNGLQVLQVTWAKESPAYKELTSKETEVECVGEEMGVLRF